MVIMILKCSNHRAHAPKEIEKLYILGLSEPFLELVQDLI